MGTTAYIFGPRKIIQELVGIDSGREHFLQAFNEIFVPLCLEKCSPSTGPKLDLLIALIDNECFPEQWNIIVTHATYPEEGTLRNSDSKVLVLAVLMEKARERIRKMKCLKGSRPEDWQHESLDIAAASIINSSPPFGTSEARFLRYVHYVCKFVSMLK